MDNFDLLNFTGSMFEDRETLQLKLSDPRIPQYQKEEMVAQHNWHYLDSMTTDPVDNIFRLNLQSPSVTTYDSNYKAPSGRDEGYLTDFASDNVFNAKEHKTEVKYDVLAKLKNVRQCISVKKVDKKPEKRDVTPAWVINRINYMFCSLIEHKENSSIVVDETEKLIGENCGLSLVFDKLRSSYADNESYLYLPGAMLIVLKKYKDFCNTASYQNLEKLYCDYMDAIINNSYEVSDCSVNLYAAKDKKYYSLINDDRWQMGSLVMDRNVYKNAMELHHRAVCTFFSNDNGQNYTEKEKPELSYEFIRCWCEPLSFYKPKNIEFLYSGISYRTGPDTVGARYAYFAKNLLKKRGHFGLIVYCLLKGCESEKNFYNNNRNFIDEFAGMCSETDDFDEAWQRLRSIFNGNADIEEKYISFCTTRICDNLEKFKKDLITVAKRVPIDKYEIDRLKEIKKKKTDDIFDVLERELKRSSCFALVNKLEDQKSIANEKYAQVYSFTKKAVTDSYAKNYWIPQNRCRYCGGEFSGVFKKECKKCGKVKDY